MAPVASSMLEEALAAAPLEPERALHVVRRLGEEIDAAARVGLVSEATEATSAPLQYVSPERILGRFEGPPSHVYALSAVLFHCLTGRLPFPRGLGKAVCFWHLHAPRPQPTDVRPDLPPAIDSVVARGMATQPELRYPTTRMFLNDAATALGVAPVSARTPRAGMSASGRLSATLAAVALAVAAGAAGFVARGGDDRAPEFARVRAGPLELTAPAGWTLLRSTFLPSSARVDHRVALAPPGAATMRVVVGTTTPEASLALLGGLHAAPPSGVLVSLGRNRARRYRSARPSDAPGLIALYLAPSDRGVVTVGCVAGAADAASFAPQCERVASSVRLAQGQFGPAVASKREATAVRHAFALLNVARDRFRRDRPRTAGQQAAAARVLALAHAREARALRSLALDGLARPGARAVTRALDAEARAYRAAAAAADDHDARGYAAARSAALAADAMLRRAVAMLRVAGYGT